jgi:DNA-binding LacI/PurR family transcriptional regulator
LRRPRVGGVPAGHLRQAQNTLADGEAATRALLELAEPPSAIIAATDLVAVGVLHAAYSLGRQVPSELSVVGFDDILIAATVRALRTLRMPIAEMVNEGVELAIQLAREPSASREPRIKVFEPSLVVRQSTAPPAATRHERGAGG